MNFYCNKCNLAFENQSPGKNEFCDPVFGQCWNYIAQCPQCGEMCHEKKEKKNLKKTGSVISSYPQSLCGYGDCCCNS